MPNTKSSDDAAQNTDENTQETSATETASEEQPAEERRKTPLELIRERQAKQQVARGKIGQKGGGSSAKAGGAAGADGVLKPPQVKRQMGG